MMAFLLRYVADSIHECQGLLEIRKSELAVEMMFIEDVPFGSLLVERLEFVPLQGRNSSTAWDALFVSKLFCH